MITLDALRIGRMPVEAMARAKEDRKKMGEGGITELLLQNKESRDYLFFASALDKLRKYAAGEKVIPGSKLHSNLQPLITKMEELDTLVAGEQAGLPEGAANPFIFSQLRENLGNFADFACFSLQWKNNDFQLGQEEVELLRSLDGMYRHFELREHPEWQTLRNVVTTMQYPVQMDDQMIDDLTFNWQQKKLVAEYKARSREALANSGSGSAKLLLNARKAALEDEKQLKEGEKLRDTPESRPYLLFYTLSYELAMYHLKYRSEMKPESTKAMRTMLDEMMTLDDVMAGPDSDPQAGEPKPEVVDAYLREKTWPSLVRYFGSFTPTSMVPKDASRIFRIMYELQNTLALPEKVDGADMRKVYNFTVEPDAEEAIWPGALENAHGQWKRHKEARDLEINPVAQEQEKKRLAEEAREKERQFIQDRYREILANDLAENIKFRRLRVKDLQARRREAEEEKLCRRLEEQKALEAEREKQRQLEEEKKRLEEEEKNKPQIPISEQDQLAQDPEIQALIKESEEKRRKQEEEKLRNPQLKVETPPPEPSEDKTWGQFAKELEDYLQEHVVAYEQLAPRSNSPTPSDIPYITQITQYLVAEGRYGKAHKDEQINTWELVQESNMLHRDKGFLKLLKKPDFRDLVARRSVKQAWERIKEASNEEYAKDSGGRTSPYNYSIMDLRMAAERQITEKKRPIKTVVDSVYLGLTDERYNADVRKTGFLFFKPENTDLYQKAVDQLGVLYRTDSKLDYRSSDIANAREAVKAYLDDRKAVRSHAYGRRRWEKLMCAYKALEKPEEFEKYCRELNTHRGITDPLDPNYVHPSAFGPERVDLKNPQVPMNEAYRRLRQDYAKANAAGEKDALLNYYSRVAAMRTQAALKLAPDGKQNPDQPIKGDWGVLLDMQKLEQQAKDLAEDSSFRSVFAGGDREALLSEAMRILAPNKEDWTGRIAERSLETAARQEKTEKSRGISKE